MRSFVCAVKMPETVLKSQLSSTTSAKAVTPREKPLVVENVLSPFDVTEMNRTFPAGDCEPNWMFCVLFPKSVIVSITIFMQPVPAEKLKPTLVFLQIVVEEIVPPSREEPRVRPAPAFE